MIHSMLVLLMMFSITAFAEVHRWVDENNKVHYSDQPPPASTKSVKLRSASDSTIPADAGSATASSGPAAPKTIAEREAELKKAQQARKEASRKAAEEQASQEAQKAKCSSAQQNLRALQEGMRIVEFDAKGERSFIDDQQRQQRIAKIQQDISSRCK